MIEMSQSRPPYIEFVRVAVDDPRRSVDLGYRVTKDVDMVHVMQPGSKDCVEIGAVAWLTSIKSRMLEQAYNCYPQEWVTAFHGAYEAWKTGQEPPLVGTSVKEWAFLSPSQAQNLIALRIITIEDVAAMTEEAMQRFGMGGRDLREKARKWIADHEVAGNLADENEALRAQLAALSARVAELESPPKVKRGRKPKEGINDVSGNSSGSLPPSGATVS